VTRWALLTPILAAGLATGMFGCDRRLTQVTAPPNTPDWLRAEAARAAASLGDRHPTVIRLFVEPKQDKIVLRGHFRCEMCSRPPGAAVQTGTVVVITLDARTHRETDFGIGNTAPDRTVT
jgi:hypothetical protein